MRVFTAGIRFQLLMFRRSLPDLMMLFVAPLFTLAFTAIMVNAGQKSIAPYVVLGPAVITMWGMALNVSGNIIESGRIDGTFEATVATPAPMATLLLGRIVAVTMVSLLSIPESAIVIRLAFGIVLHIPHAAVFVITVLATALAMSGTAVAMSALFVLARSARIFQNSISYPFYILSGAIVPPALLPHWLRPLTVIIFLSWSTGMMRAAMSAPPIHGVITHLIAIVGLGILGYMCGLYLMQSVLRRLRSTGSVGRV